MVRCMNKLSDGTVDSGKASAELGALAAEFREIATSLSGLAGEFREVALVRDCADKLEECRRLLIRQYRDGVLSEGQVAAATGLDRPMIRAMADSIEHGEDKPAGDMMREIQAIRERLIQLMKARPEDSELKAADMSLAQAVDQYRSGSMVVAQRALRRAREALSRHEKARD